MKRTNLWMKAKGVSIQVSDSIRSGFDIGFDKRIPQAMQDELRTFVKWVEHNYVVPVTLWVNFEYRHYLMSGSKRVAICSTGQIFLTIPCLIIKTIFRSLNFLFGQNTVLWKKSLFPLLKQLPIIMPGFATKFHRISFRMIMMSRRFFRSTCAFVDNDAAFPDFQWILSDVYRGIPGVVLFTYSSSSPGGNMI